MCEPLWHAVDRTVHIAPRPRTDFAAHTAIRRTDKLDLLRDVRSHIVTRERRRGPNASADRQVRASAGMSATIRLLDWVGDFLARYVSKPTSGYEPYAAARPELVAMTIRPADVLLVEGARSKINSAIRYLTQSTWSHAALYVGTRRQSRRTRRRAAGADRGRARQGRDRLAAVEIQHLQHPHLPSGRSDARGSQRGHPLCGRAHRLRLRPEEHHRPDALFPAAAAGAGALAAAHDRAGLRRADARDLLDA